ncbi:kinase-like protein [Staphylotrichum tortipilum]|uniref:Kinase-like protein n=1 Tax=Staphylotrichum tortipilum TaxID=2831512 RepID=A0AAN6MCK8_9PEZI|nr:kinase-like protein [Staphylotrichum longicolle]
MGLRELTTCTYVRVKRVLTSGGSAWIGEVDDSTVLKYPAAAGEDVERIEAEKNMLQAIPPYKHVIGFKGFTDEGIYLERAINGTVVKYILESGQPISLQQRLAWCRQTAEAVAWVHVSRAGMAMLPSNLLLDKDLHVKLSDFQGKLLTEDGTVLADGWSMEGCRFSCPRGDDDFRANIKMDLFALGCTIYFIVMGHAIYPVMVDGEESYRRMVGERLAKRDWPREQHVCGAITLKCWEQQYESAAGVVRDLEIVEQEHELDAGGSGSGPDGGAAGGPERIAVVSLSLCIPYLITLA